jgi:hypothetical protein
MTFDGLTQELIELAITEDAAPPDVHFVYVMYEECEGLDGYTCGVWNATQGHYVKPYPDAPDEFVTSEWAQAEKWWKRTTERMGVS